MSLLFEIIKLLEESKRRIFVSYHHGSDQSYYNDFSNVFAKMYKAITDSSVDRKVDSDDPEYVMRRIREKYITGTSCTIVLCGPHTHLRKYVDWEIKATLDKSHGLVGIQLPNNTPNSNGKIYVPARLNDNIKSGYAIWFKWQNLLEGSDYLKYHIEVANNRSKLLIRNERELRKRNREW